MFDVFLDLKASSLILENFTEVLNWSVWLCGAAVVVVLVVVVVVVVVVVPFFFASSSLGRTVFVVVDDVVDCGRGSFNSHHNPDNPPTTQADQWTVDTKISNKK